MPLIDSPRLSAKSKAVEQWGYSIIAQIIGLHLGGLITSKLGPRIDRHFSSTDSRFLVQNLATALALTTTVSILWTNPIGFMGSLVTFLVVYGFFFAVGAWAHRQREI